MVEVKDKEDRIDIRKVEEERLEIVNALSKVLVKEETSDLLAQSLYYRLEKIGAYEYFTYFEELVTKAKLRLKDYPNLSGYIEMVKIFNEINKDVLFEECEAISSKIQGKYLKRPEERELLQVKKDMNVLRNFYHLELTRADLQYYYENEEGLKAQKLLEKLNALAASAGKKVQLQDVTFLDDHLE